MDTRARIQQLLDERNWSVYRLAEKCGLSQSTLANIFRRNTVPSIATLESICRAFGISMAQFFAEGNMVELTPELKEVFDRWVTLTADQKAVVLQMLRTFNNK